MTGWLIIKRCIQWGNGLGTKDPLPQLERISPPKKDNKTTDLTEPNGGLIYPTEYCTIMQ